MKIAPGLKFVLLSLRRLSDGSDRLKALQKITHDRKYSVGNNTMVYASVWNPMVLHSMILDPGWISQRVRTSLIST